MTYTITNVTDDGFTMDDITIAVNNTHGVVTKSNDDNVNVGTPLRVIDMPNVGDVVDVYDGWLYPVIDGAPDGVTLWSTTNKQRVKQYHDGLRETLNRSKYNGRIHVIYTTACDHYIRAVVEHDGMAYRWWYYNGRWACNTCPSCPAVPMSKSRAANRAPWDGNIVGGWMRD